MTDHGIVTTSRCKIVGCGFWVGFAVVTQKVAGAPSWTISRNHVRVS
jgi:hypothetical protein